MALDPNNTDTHPPPLTSHQTSPSTTHSPPDITLHHSHDSADVCINQLLVEADVAKSRVFEKLIVPPQVDQEGDHDDRVRQLLMRH